MVTSITAQPSPSRRTRSRALRPVCRAALASAAIGLFPFLSAVAQPPQPAAGDQQAVGDQQPAPDTVVKPRLSLDFGMGQTDNLFHDTTNLRSDISSFGLRLNVGANRPRLLG